MLSITTLLSLSALCASSFAIPNVTSVPLTGTCADYPTDPFLLAISHSDNSTIEGFGDTSQVIRRSGDTGIHEGLISIAANDQLAKTVFRCNSATGPGALEALTPTGVSGFAWNQVNISDIPYDAVLGWGFGQYSTPVEAYSLFGEDGEQLEGTFLGQDNYTEWAVKLYPADSGSLDGNPYWGLRLLGNNSAVPGTDGQQALEEGEYRTFLTLSS